MSVLLHRPVRAPPQPFAPDQNWSGWGRARSSEPPSFSASLFCSSCTFPLQGSQYFWIYALVAAPLSIAYVPFGGQEMGLMLGLALTDAQRLRTVVVELW